VSRIIQIPHDLYTINMNVKTVTINNINFCIKISLPYRKDIMQISFITYCHVWRNSKSLNDYPLQCFEKNKNTHIKEISYQIFISKLIRRRSYETKLWTLTVNTFEESSLSPNHWTRRRRPQHMVMKLQVLVWNRHKNAAGSNGLVGSQSFNHSSTAWITIDAHDLINYMFYYCYNASCSVYDVMLSVSAQCMTSCSVYDTRNVWWYKHIFLTYTPS
jgi:hypothetical protein